VSKTVNLHGWFCLSRDKNLKTKWENNTEKELPSRNTKWAM
jgi:hypothetical protein